MTKCGGCKMKQIQTNTNTKKDLTFKKKYVYYY